MFSFARFLSRRNPLKMYARTVSRRSWQELGYTHAGVTQPPAWMDRDATRQVIRKVMADCGLAAAPAVAATISPKPAVPKTMTLAMYRAQTKAAQRRRAITRPAAVSSSGGLRGSTATRRGRGRL